jgi:hypothetical protein
MNDILPRALWSIVIILLCGLIVTIAWTVPDVASIVCTVVSTTLTVAQIVNLWIYS